MITIGGKIKTVKPTKPQYVVQLAANLNEFAKLEWTGGDIDVTWIGDPNAATKFDSKYAAKARMREFEVPATRCFKEVYYGQAIAQSVHATGYKAG